MNDLITLTTDFGLSEYVAALKGVILSINPGARIIDISHDIRPQNMVGGAYVLYCTVPYFPDVVHVGVVDPGVGTERAGLVISCEKGVLVGPDNGLLLPAARALGLKKVYNITNGQYFQKEISNTFHGRDIFAPVAAHISMGVELDDIGEEVDEYVDLSLKYHVESEGIVKGKIIHVDTFGNLITSITKETINKHHDFGDTLSIEYQGKIEKIKKTLPFLPSYGHAEKGELLATISSSGFFEIACNQCSAAKVLNFDSGDIIRLKI
jgi:S-adenosylmethionine hydrolase